MATHELNKYSLKYYIHSTGSIALKKLFHKCQNSEAFIVNYTNYLTKSQQFSYFYSGYCSISFQPSRQKSKFFNEANLPSQGRHI